MPIIDSLDVLLPAHPSWTIVINNIPIGNDELRNQYLDKQGGSNIWGSRFQGF
jgi:hypothetical protein